MPVTRSQKDAPSRPGSRPSDKDATGEMSGSEGVTDRGCNCHTAASEDNGQKDEAAQKETTKKTSEDIPDKGVHGSATTLKAKGVSRRARSMKTTNSSARRWELEAREELARMEMKRAQAAAKLARVRLELESEEEDSVDGARRQNSIGAELDRNISNGRKQHGKTQETRSAPSERAKCEA
ncbi:unnamed protein product [Parnassius apollo]|uniref:(apollo) hypothetical protein n=1 Tax=Parnassius apollo TaxID=110799 RepID=A0A8S3Y5B3_PARAO|nr:unnamed protein product [Parnassius apollo]